MSEFNNVKAVIGGPINKPSESFYKNKIISGNHSFASQVVSSNTKYVIRFNFDLNNQEVTIPENCVLEFDGGIISNGTLIGNNTKIVNLYDYKIFHNIQKEGTFLYLTNIFNFEERP